MAERVNGHLVRIESNTTVEQGVAEGATKIHSDKEPKLTGWSFQQLDSLCETAGSDYVKFDRAIKKNLALPAWTNTLELYGVYARKLNEVKSKTLAEGTKSDIEHQLFDQLSQRSLGSMDSASVGDRVSLLHLTTLNIPGHKVVAKLNGFLTPKQIVKIVNTGMFQQLEFADGSRYPEKDGGDIFQQTQTWNMTKLFPSADAASKAFMFYVLAGQKLSDVLDFQTNVEQGMAEGKITLSTDPNWYGATVDNYQASGPVVNIPANQLVGFEPDDKMNQPKSKVNVEKIVAGLKQGAKLPPLLVRKYKNGYQVLDGHHRFWAYKLLSVKSIPAQIVPDSDIEEISKQGVAEGVSGSKYKVKSVGQDKKGEYYISPSTGEKVYKKAKVGDHEVPGSKEIKPKLEAMLPKTAFAGSDKNKLGPAAHLKGSMKRPARQGDLVGGSAEESVEEEKQRLDPKCWKGYRKAGTKMKGGTRVNNCVPVSESAEKVMVQLIKMLESK